MASTHDASTAIKWYRTPIPAGELRALNTRSDIKGLIQAGGFLTLLCCTGVKVNGDAQSESAGG